MNRDQLEHVLRAAADIVPDSEMLVIGSQAVLAERDADDLPDEAVRSIEVDIAFFDDPDAARADAVDGAIGGLSRFHETFGYYGQGVSVETAVLPSGWHERLRQMPAGDRSRARCLEIHDCVVSKLVADRQKDREFAAALLRVGLVDASVLIERIEGLPDAVPAALRDAIRGWLVRQARALD